MKKETFIFFIVSSYLLINELWSKSNNMIRLKSLITERINVYNQANNFNQLLEDIRSSKSTDTLLREYIGHIAPSSPISYYLKNYKKLEDKEVNALIQKYQKKKDSKAFDELIKMYSKYMVKMIMKNKSKLEKVDKNITTEEVFNAMIINFQKAMVKFDATKDLKFITYLDK